MLLPLLGINEKELIGGLFERLDSLPHAFWDELEMIIIDVISGDMKAQDRVMELLGLIDDEY